MEEQKKDLSILWKLGFMLLLGLVMGIFYMQSVSAYNVFKWQLCDSANVSSGLCDDYWEQFKTAMGINEEVQTNFSASDYYNRTEVDKKLQDVNVSIIPTTTINESVKDDLIAEIMVNLTQTYATKEEQSMLRENLIGQDIGEPIARKTETNDDKTLLYVVLILAVFGFGYLIFKDKFTPRQDNQLRVRQIYRPIQRAKATPKQEPKILSRPKHQQTEIDEEQKAEEAEYDDVEDY